MEENLTEADEGNEQTDARADGHDERLRHDAGEPLTKTEDREEEENTHPRSENTNQSRNVLFPLGERQGIRDIDSLLFDFVGDERPLLACCNDTLALQFANMKFQCLDV